jgi:hypothetical protein
MMIANAALAIFALMAAIYIGGMAVREAGKAISLLYLAMSGLECGAFLYFTVRLAHG